VNDIAATSDPSPSGRNAAPDSLSLVSSLRFVVVGAGRLGTSLALALRSRGALLLGYSSETDAGRRRAESYLGGRACSSLEDLVALSPGLYVIAVPDDALPAVAGALGDMLAAHRPSRPHPGPTASVVTEAVPTVIHTSGGTSVAVLEPCVRAGASTLVFHPLQTFTDPIGGATRFAGAAIAITAGRAATGRSPVDLGFALAHGLGSRPFSLPDDKRSLYHAAATFASNYLVTLEHVAEQLFVAAGLPETEALGLFLPLVKATIDNVQAHGTVPALTGPLSRGDRSTIAAHLEVLEAEAPAAAALYRSLGLATLPLVHARGELDPTLVDALAATLAEEVPLSDEGETDTKQGIQ